MKDNSGLGGEVLGKIPNKYLAVIVSSKRAKALNDGARPLVKAGATKPTTVALEEIAAGIVVPDTEKPEIKPAKKKRKKALPAPDDGPKSEEK